MFHVLVPVNEAALALSWSKLLWQHVVLLAPHRCSTNAALALDNGLDSQLRIAAARIALPCADAFGELGSSGALCRRSVSQDCYCRRSVCQGVALGAWVFLIAGFV